MGKKREGASYKLKRQTKTEIINTAEHLSTDYEEGHFVNIVKGPN